MIDKATHGMAISLAGLRRLEEQIQQTMARVRKSEPSPEVNAMARRTREMQLNVSEAAERTQERLSNDGLDVRA